MRTQENINATAKHLTDTVLKGVDFSSLEWTRFDYKQCWVSECVKNRYFIVKSYNTIVAVIDDQNGELFELGKWSPTTSKQVTQLYNLSDIISYKKFGYSKLHARYLVK